jgi:hypothetical protein
MTNESDTSAFNPADITFVTRGVTHTEAAAVTAVLRGLLREESQDLQNEPDRARSGWALSQRSIRPQLTPGAGRWRSFSG